MKGNMSLKELYELRRNGRLSIWGTALGAYSAFWQWLLIYKLWLGGDDDNDSPPSNFPKNMYQLIHIPDGYALVFLSPIMLIWWILCSIFMFLLFSLIIGYFLFLGCMHIIFSLPFPIIALYSIIFEYPASVLNRDLGKKDLDKYDPQDEWEHK